MSRCCSSKTISISPPWFARKSEGIMRSNARNMRCETVGWLAFMLFVPVKEVLREPGFLKELHGARLIERQLHAFGFRKRDFPAQLREAIVAATLVIETNLRTFV